jgi:hypothetical protein
LRQPLQEGEEVKQVGSTLLIACLALRLSATGADDFQVGALMAAHALGMVCGGGAGAR